MKVKLGKRFWTAMVIFGLMGQIAWVVENMYFNVFIYKIFNASALSISIMVAASAVVATLTTWLMGALSDKFGKRKIFISLGYVLWGISILAFAFIRMDILTPLAGGVSAAMQLGVTIVIIMDCVMTFFGATANDASFNAWLTDCGNDGNRGKIEGINSMMPLIAILVVFGGFMSFDLNKAESWSTIFTIIGIAVIVIGFSGIFLVKDKSVKTEETSHYFRNVSYCFRPKVVRENKLLYLVVLAYAIFGVSIQIFMPYLILYYEQTLKMDNYVIIMAPAIVVAAIVTAFWGKLYDKVGFKTSVGPALLLLAIGYFVMIFAKNTGPVLAGSMVMLSGYLSGMATFGAMIRDNIPENRAGMFQGLRIFGMVFVPGVVGPLIGAAVLSNAEMVVNNDGTESFIPNVSIFIAAIIVCGACYLVLLGIFRMMRVNHHNLVTNIEPDNWINEYPRPQLKRDSFLCLNGEWKLNNSKVIVPYPPQSFLSGYKKMVSPILNYEKEFVLPDGFEKGGRTILHFGAVDQVCDIILNKKYLMHHEGGYLPFEFDVTDALNRDGNVNILEVKVKDFLDKRYPYGKQRNRRGGMWYTPVSGIWQSVWMENVPDNYFEKIKITPQNLNEVKFEFDLSGGSKVTKENPIKITIFMDGFEYKVCCENPEKKIDLSRIVEPSGKLHTPRNWNPDDPYLYRVKLEYMDDKVETYFALRIVEIRVINGRERVCLNEYPIFLNGVLDQGYFSDGLYLPGNPKGYEEDILNMKELGFNLLRKHIKVEPERFYYDCDRLGMLVMQDMVNSGIYNFLFHTAFPSMIGRKINDKIFKIRNNNTESDFRKKFFVEHSCEIIEHLYNHPSVISYTVFNESWGQFDSDNVGDLLKSIDKTRIYDYTSGWFTQKKSDLESLHIYFKPPNFATAGYKKPILISEFGGFSNSVEGHEFSVYGKYGYGDCKNMELLTSAIEKEYEKLIIPNIGHGLCGCVYTQLSDVEDEVNGFYTYDRKVCKVDKERIRKISEKLSIL